MGGLRLSEEFLTLPENERRPIYLKASDFHDGLAPEAIEKDVWVCLVLSALFGNYGWPSTVFKGGTSLSKAYAAIERFSEDIDLTVGFTDANSEDGPLPETINKAKRFRTLVNGLLEDHLTSVVVPHLESSLGKFNASVTKQGADVFVAFPSCFQAGDYLGSEVKLEFGARNRITPSEQRHLTTYVAEVLPPEIALPEATVDVLSPKRTFWEKATLAHDICNKKEWATGKEERMSRHWYDLDALAKTTIGDDALADRTLLADVVKVKGTFFKTPTSDYEACLTGGLRLVPNQERCERLDQDFSNMVNAGMFPGSTPNFRDILTRLQELEDTVNSGSS